MTKKLLLNKKGSLGKTSLIIFIVCSILFFAYSDALKNYILYGIRLSVVSIIPSLFPFFVISDYLYKNSDFSNDGFFCSLFQKIFGISGRGAVAFALGNLCGFPLGAKCAAELYQDGLITKDECERLVIISNNPSLAFVISYVGAGLFGSITIGIKIYLSIIFSSVILGLILRKKYRKNEYSTFIKRQNYNFSDSIKDAGVSSLTVSSFIIFFSGIIGILKELIKKPFWVLLFSSVLEVGGGVSEIANSSLDSLSKLLLSAFSLGFSGLSVFLQAFSFLPSQISKYRLFTFKIFQAILSCFFVILFCLLPKLFMV